MNYPINFDFGKHWKSKIVPHLDNPKLLKSIRDGVNNYSSIKRYRKNTPPALYSSVDTYSRLMEQKEKRIIQQLRKDNKLPTRYLQMEKKILDSDDDEDELYIQFTELEKKILKPYVQWNMIKNDIEAYVLFSGCFSWSATFELTLAQLVEPEEEWYVRSGKLHSTVINKKNDKLFDILYWSCDTTDTYELDDSENESSSSFGDHDPIKKCTNLRIENYMFGYQLIKNVLDDITLGGKKAYIDSS